MTNRRRHSPASIPQQAHQQQQQQQGQGQGQQRTDTSVCKFYLDHVLTYPDGSMQGTPCKYKADCRYLHIMPALEEDLPRAPEEEACAAGAARGLPSAAISEGVAAAAPHHPAALQRGTSDPDDGMPQLLEEEDTDTQSSGGRECSGPHANDWYLTADGFPSLSKVPDTQAERVTALMKRMLDHSGALPADAAPAALTAAAPPPLPEVRQPAAPAAAAVVGSQLADRMRALDCAGLDHHVPGFYRSAVARGPASSRSRKPDSRKSSKGSES